jgi:ABC-type Fe3+-hydroxamate transport system substrate-binding protein
LALLSVAVGVALAGCSLPSSSTTPPSPSASTTPTRTATPTPTPTPTPTTTPTPSPTYTPLPPAEGTDPAPSGDWTTDLAYQACVDAPNADPDNAIVSYSPESASRVDQSGPGVWLVVIPVTRSVSGTPTAGQQVCFIDGTPESPSVSVATSL